MVKKMVKKTGWENKKKLRNMKMRIITCFVGDRARRGTLLHII